MSYADSNNPYRSFGMPVAQEDVDVRSSFLRKTYMHLTVAVLGFAVICGVLLQLDPVKDLCKQFVMTPYLYLIAMFGMMGVSWVCEKWAANSVSVGTQYAGLALYTVAESLFFLPMLWIANTYFPGAILSAGVITLTVFTGLTLSVLMTRADFSFLRTGLFIAGFALMGLVICMMLMPRLVPQFSGFSVLLMGAFVVLAAGFILYNTSQVLHHYPVGMHVAAALALFASLTTLFWYVLQLMMALNRRD